MAGLVESAYRSRMEEKKQGEMGRIRKGVIVVQKEQPGSRGWKSEIQLQMRVRRIKVRSLLVVGLAKAFEKVQLKVVWLWLPVANPQSIVRVLSAPAKGGLRRLCG